MVRNLENALIHSGYIKKGSRSGSSHYTFTKAGHPPITIPQGLRMTDGTYAKMVRGVIIRDVSVNKGRNNNG
ncbi:MAG: hypothetical protein FWD01_05015 [Defluviitaleaceae bacterium]|nr:hypothetical protein [Defluviitaleaceae bacterium]